MLSVLALITSFSLDRATRRRVRELVRSNGACCPSGCHSCIQAACAWLAAACICDEEMGAHADTVCHVLTVHCCYSLPAGMLCMLSRWHEPSCRLAHVQASSLWRRARPCTWQICRRCQSPFCGTSSIACGTGSDPCAFAPSSRKAPSGAMIAWKAASTVHAHAHTLLLMRLLAPCPYRSDRAEEKHNFLQPSNCPHAVLQGWAAALERGLMSSIDRGSACARLRASPGMKATEGWKKVHATQYFSATQPGTHLIMPLPASSTPQGLCQHAMYTYFTRLQPVLPSKPSSDLD